MNIHPYFFLLINIIMLNSARFLLVLFQHHKI